MEEHEARPGSPPVPVHSSRRPYSPENWQSILRAFAVWKGTKGAFRQLQGIHQATLRPGKKAGHGVAERLRVFEVACWAHTRRKFFDAQDTDPRRGQAALAYIHRLYDVERLARNLSARERQKMRQQQARPVLAGFKVWLDAQAMLVLPKSAMGEAMGYALRQWKALCRYIEDGDLAIDNNAAENSLRCVALGRKNWLFAGSDAGGHRAALLYSLIASCKKHHVDPQAYL
jgi:transposase